MPLWAVANDAHVVPLNLSIDDLDFLSDPTSMPLTPVGKVSLQLPMAAPRPIEIVLTSPLPGMIRAGRPHHALRMATQTVAHTLRQFGFQVSQCETLTRLPSKLSQNGGSTRLRVALTVNVSCKY